MPSLRKITPRLNGLYWWKPDADTSLLCRCVFASSVTVGFRVLFATPEQIIKWGKGPGETFHFVPDTQPIEEVK
jgi:hypothetical protein